MRIYSFLLECVIDLCIIIMNDVSLISLDTVFPALQPESVGHIYVLH